MFLGLIPMLVLASSACISPLGQADLACLTKPEGWTEVSTRDPGDDTYNIRSFATLADGIQIDVRRNRRDAGTRRMMTLKRCANSRGPGLEMTCRDTSAATALLMSFSDGSKKHHYADIVIKDGRQSYVRMEGRWPAAVDAKARKVFDDLLAKIMTR